jgi:hypothetical protein
VEQAAACFSFEGRIQLHDINVSRQSRCAKIFPGSKSFERPLLCSQTRTFRSIQKNFRCRDLANGLSLTAIGNRTAISPERHCSAAVEDCDLDLVEIKLTHVRH